LWGLESSQHDPALSDDLFVFPPAGLDGDKFGLDVAKVFYIFSPPWILFLDVY